jgi:hypothetical protein
MKEKQVPSHSYHPEPKIRHEKEQQVVLPAFPLELGKETANFYFFRPK